MMFYFEVIDADNDTVTVEAYDEETKEIVATVFYGVGEDGFDVWSVIDDVALHNEEYDIGDIFNELDEQYESIADAVRDIIESKTDLFVFGVEQGNIESLAVMPASQFCRDYKINDYKKWVSNGGCIDGVMEFSSVQTAVDFIKNSTLTDTEKEIFIEEVTRPNV